MERKELPCTVTTTEETISISNHKPRAQDGGTYSTRRSMPAQNELASDARNTVGPLYSHARETRSRGLSSAHRLSSSGFAASNISVIAVLIYPGLIVFTLIPLPAHSALSERQSWCTAALDVLLKLILST